jgi:restriction system protein
LILTKDGHKIAVQAKRYSKPVGVRAVQEALAAAGMYGCERALVVTNRSFTTQAIKLASANDVRLWDRDALVNAILDADDDSGAAGALADAI